jgi:hypothetical protein
MEAKKWKSRLLFLSVSQRDRCENKSRTETGHICNPWSSVLGGRAALFGDFRLLEHD